MAADADGDAAPRVEIETNMVRREQANRARGRLTRARRSHLTTADGRLRDSRRARSLWSCTTSTRHAPAATLRDSQAEDTTTASPSIASWRCVVRDDSARDARRRLAVIARHNSPQPSSLRTPAISFEQGFVIQGGDPTGSGRGGDSIYGGPFEDEIHPDLGHRGAGILSMVRNPREKGKPERGQIRWVRCAHVQERAGLIPLSCAGERREEHEPLAVLRDPGADPAPRR